MKKLAKVRARVRVKDRFAVHGFKRLYEGYL